MDEFSWSFFVGICVAALDVLATFLILHGAFLSLSKFIRIEVLRKDEPAYEAKRVFIEKIILALDFFVASDLLKLMLDTSFNEIASIFLIVIIRTMLWWSLHKEIALSGAVRKR